MNALPPLNLETIKFLQAPRRMLIDGAWVNAASGETIDVFNPATEEKIATVPAGGAADIDAAVKAARRAFDDGKWTRMAASERGKLLWKLAELIEANGPRLTEVEVLDNGMALNPAGKLAVPLAAATLRELGFGRATALDGGMTAWRESGYAVEK